MHDFIKKYHCITHPYLHNTLIAIVFFAVVFGVWFGAEDALLDYWNKKIVLTYLSSFTSDWVLTTSCVLISLFVLAVVVYRFTIRYQYRLSVVGVALVLITMLFRYRFIETSLYDYLSIYTNSNFKYIDFVIIWSVIYVVAAIINFFLSHAREQEFSTSATTHTESPAARRLENGIIVPVLQSDQPILSSDYDILDYDNEISKLTEEIVALPVTQSWSIAISAPWGAGKSSFMNMLKLSLHNRGCEQIEFAPRNSKSAELIQSDFFNQLVDLVGKTDARVKNSMHKYLELLGLIDNSGIISKFINSALFKEEDAKQSMIEIFAEYPHRIIVYVEDFDRLTRVEIIEVLKLIDNNAAFPNIIFITAYDKENVNVTLNQGNTMTTTPFVDKFFNFEYTLPKRPYTYIKHYLHELLAQIIDNKMHKVDLQSIFDEDKHEMDLYLQPCICTLRDAKRFYNLFATDYAHLQEDVVFKEFLFVELLKYHFIDVYHKLHSHEYLMQDDTTWKLKENCPVDEPAKSILTELFTIQKENEYGETIEQENPYRHIYDTDYFDNYFVNDIYGYLRIKDMRKTIEDGLEKSSATIDKWFDDDIKKDDYCNFLDKVIREDFTSKEQYLNYVDIYLYIVIHHHNKMLSWSKENILRKEYAHWRLDKLGISEKEFKSYLLQSINNVTWDPLMTFQRSLLMEIIDDKKAAEYYITYNDLFPIIKRQFRIILEDKSIGDKDKYEYLKGCVFKTEDFIKLVENCCSRYKQYIKRNPEWFVANFVQLGETPSSPEVNSITCIPFLEQIFGDRNKVDSFLSMKDNDTTPYIKRARNFWRLYRANEYQPIEFKNQGNVQAKIDNDLNNEISQLEELEQIKQEVKTLQELLRSKEISKKQVQYKVSQLERKLSKSQLYIRLNGKIREEINKLKEEIHEQ